MKQDEIEQLEYRVKTLERRFDLVINEIPIKFRSTGLFGRGEVLFKPKEDLELKVEKVGNNYNEGNFATLDTLPEHLKKKLEWHSVNDKPEQGKWILYGNHRMLKMGRYGITLFENYKDEIIAYLPVTHWAYLELPPAVRYDELWPKPNLEEASSASSETQDSPGE